MAQGHRAEATVSGNCSHTESYVMPAGIEATWKAFTDPAARQAWFGFALDQLTGALEADPPRLLRVAIDHPGLPGPTETTVTFEALDDGSTRIRHTLGGYGEGPMWENALQSSAYGIDEMMGDLALYLRTGAGFPRHIRFRCFDLLKGTRQVPGGLEVFEAPPGTLPAEVGMQPGDLVVALAGAGVYGFRDVLFATRSHAPGDEIEVSWVRDGEILSGRGHLTGTMPVRAETP
jgi:uncharacterized protein YndB with AHSA1/START domain